MKSGSRTIYVKLILSFSFYRCHGNIDFFRKVHQPKLQSGAKTNNWCKFLIYPTEISLLKSQLKKLGVVSKKLYRKTLKLKEVQKRW